MKATTLTLMVVCMVSLSFGRAFANRKESLRREVEKVVRTMPPSDLKRNHNVQVRPGLQIRFDGVGRGFHGDPETKWMVTVETGKVQRQFWASDATGKVDYGFTLARFANKGTLEAKLTNRGKVYLERTFRAVDQHGQPLVVVTRQPQGESGSLQGLKLLEYFPAKFLKSDGDRTSIWSKSYKANHKLSTFVIP